MLAASRRSRVQDMVRDQESVHAEKPASVPDVAVETPRPGARHASRAARCPRSALQNSIAASEAFATRRATPAAERSEALLRIADALQARSTQFVARAGTGR